MKATYEAVAHVFGRNIDTDQIYPARYLDIVEPADIALHVLEGADPSFASRLARGDIVVAGTNFGCGSSREHAVIALQSAGISVVVAESFARIFYRNAINLALPVLVCKGVSTAVSSGELLSVDLLEGTVRNNATGTVLQAEKLSSHVMHILQSGGIKNMFRNQQREAVQ